MPGPEGRSYLERNREVWTRAAVEYAGWAPRKWERDEIEWGVWTVPESDVGALGDVEGLDVIDLGCGTGYFSSWLARRGARPVGIDPTPAQLATAREMQRRYGARFPLVEASAEHVPLPDGSFDLALSEYGASIWCDPFLWIPEAARLLRPGGRLVFLCNSALVMACTPDVGPADSTLVRDYFGMHRLDWQDTGEVEFHLTHGDWFSVLHANGFDVENLVELRAPEGATTRHPEYVTSEWAHRWPAEEIWMARKRF